MSNYDHLVRTKVLTHCVPGFVKSYQEHLSKSMLSISSVSLIGVHAFRLDFSTHFII